MDKEFWKQFKSYPRFRAFQSGILKCELSDKYVWMEHNGNLICTDQYDTDCWDGNICLVTPDGDVLHIGVIPSKEWAENQQIKIQGDELILSYKELRDNSHQHSRTTKEKFDITLTENRQQEIRQNRVAKILYDELEPICAGLLNCTRLTFMNVANGGIEIHLNVDKYGGDKQHRTKEPFRVNIFLAYNKELNCFSYSGGLVYWRGSRLNAYFSDKEPEKYEETMKDINYGVVGGLDKILSAIDKANENIKSMSVNTVARKKRMNIERD